MKATHTDYKTAHAIYVDSIEFPGGLGLPPGFEWVGTDGGAWIFRHRRSGLTGAFGHCERSAAPRTIWQDMLTLKAWRLRARARLAR